MSKGCWAGRRVDWIIGRRLGRWALGGGNVVLPVTVASQSPRHLVTSTVAVVVAVRPRPRPRSRLCWREHAGTDDDTVLVWEQDAKEQSRQR
ncbi:hypothetical protein F4803DRAFT_547473 [Xylaria telfairii]|nr:hypothetical protein F4803DRAFT_547473 [Xylaria telfairii]